jgi:hypothetical protein
MTDTKLGSMLYSPLRLTQPMTHISLINCFLGLAHGAVLRLTRPGEVRTYMVVPQFPKRVDAKNAVCLVMVALAAGVGTYMRAISVALEAKISPEMKTLVYEGILNTEHAKYWPNKLSDMFEYMKDRDGTYDLFVLHGDVSLTT